MRSETKKLIYLTVVFFLLNKILILVPSIYVHRSLFLQSSFFSAWKYILCDNFAHWDSGWYLTIANDGYNIKGSAFFPIYPISIRLLSYITHRPLVTGILISNVSFFLLIYFFIKLLRLDYSLKDTCKITLLLVLFPTSFYFSSLYTESLFMLFSILFLYFLRKGNWMWASMFGMLAGGTRNTGVLLALPFAIEFLSNHFKLYNGALFHKKIVGILWGIFIPAIAFIYMGYLWIRFNDLFAFSHAQKLFGRTFMAPWNTLVHGYVFNLRMIHQMVNKASYLELYYILELVFVTLVLITLILSFKKIRLSYWIILLYSLLVPLADPVHGKVNDYFNSISRYILVIVPMYVAFFEVFKARVLYISFAVLSAVLLVVLTFYWSSRFWVA